MEGTDRRIVRVGDKVACRRCGYEFSVKQEHLERLAQPPHAPTERLRPAVTASVEGLAQMPCTSCGYVGTRKVSSATVVSAHGGEDRQPGHELGNTPAMPSADGQPSFQVKCSVCGFPAIPGDSLCHTHSR